jgi:ribonuclease HI
LSYAEATRGRFPKIDADGSFSKQCGNDGWGVIARDCDEYLRRMVAHKLQNLSDPLHVEATSITNALKIVDVLDMGKSS